MKFNTNLPWGDDEYRGALLIVSDGRRENLYGSWSEVRRTFKIKRLRTALTARNLLRFYIRN